MVCTKAVTFPVSLTLDPSFHYTVYYNTNNSFEIIQSQKSTMPNGHRRQHSTRSSTTSSSNPVPQFDTLAIANPMIQSFDEDLYYQQPYVAPRRLEQRPPSEASQRSMSTRSSTSGRTYESSRAPSTAPSSQGSTVTVGDSLRDGHTPGMPEWTYFNSGESKRHRWRLSSSSNTGPATYSQSVAERRSQYSRGRSRYEGGSEYSRSGEDRRSEQDCERRRYDDTGRTPTVYDDGRGELSPYDSISSAGFNAPRRRPRSRERDRRGDARSSVVEESTTSRRDRAYEDYRDRSRSRSRERARQRANVQATGLPESSVSSPSFTGREYDYSRDYDTLKYSAAGVDFPKEYDPKKHKTRVVKPDYAL